LAKLYNKFGDKGLEILAYPCDLVKKHEPGNPDEIQRIATKYNVAFKIMELCKINGDDSNELWTFLRKNSELQGADVPNSFAKFLCNSKGEVLHYYEPNFEPNGIVPDIEKILGITPDTE